MTAFVLFTVPGIPLRSDTAVSPAEFDTGDQIPMVDWASSETTPQPEQPTLPSFPELSSADERIVSEYRPATASVGDRDNVAARKSFDAVEVVPTATLVIGLPAVLAATWLGVLLLLLIAFVRSAVSSQMIIARAECDVPTKIAGAAKSACELLEIRKCPQWVISQDSRVPFTAGLFRPVIVLPHDAHEWSPDKLAMVIAHELAHVERRDIMWHWVGRAAVGLAWFNPLVWLAARRGQLDRERGCDDRVIQLGFTGTEYGQCLVEVAATLSDVGYRSRSLFRWRNLP